LVTICEAISNKLYLEGITGLFHQKSDAYFGLVKFMMYQTLHVKESDQHRLEFWPQVQPFLKWR
jgi:hypothetical protein